MENTRIEYLSLSDRILNFAVDIAATTAFPEIAFVGFLSGFEAYLEGDYVTAFKEWELLAHRGDIESQFALGMMYLNGVGVPCDEVRANKWFSLMATDGDVEVNTVIDLAAYRMTPD